MYRFCRNESNAVGLFMLRFICMRSSACSLCCIRRHYPPAPHGPHVLLDQFRIVPLLGQLSLFFRIRTLAEPRIKSLRITPRPCFSSGTHTRPSSSPPSSISCSRICLRTAKCRRPSFANVVCQGKPMRNSDGVVCPERSGFSLSDLLGGNRRWGEILLLLSVSMLSTESTVRMAFTFCNL